MSSNRIVATCWASDPDALLEAVARAQQQLATAREAPSTPHLIEARLDLLAHPASTELLAALAARAQGRLLLTCRPGGSGDPGGADRIGLLRRGLDDGAAGCDLEHDAADLRIREDRLLVISLHSDAPGAAAAFDASQQLAAAAPARERLVLKLAFPVHDANEAFEAVHRAMTAIPASLGFAPVAMGSAGTWLRVLAGRVVAATGRPSPALAYVAAERHLPGTPLGQPLLKDALGPLGVDRIGAATRIFGVVGWPLDATWSPLLHGELFRRRGIDAVLVPLPVRDGTAGLRLLERLGAEGAAITMPHKQRWLDEPVLASGTARRCGSVNTLRRGREGWEAESFDGAAALWALERAAGAVRGWRVGVLGSGGAAAATVDALIGAGAQVVVLARDAVAANALAARFEATAGSLDDASLVASLDALVNATPCGSAAHPAGPLRCEALPRRAVLDMVTTPPATELLRAAARAGLATADGLSMLAHQAAAQQEYWTGPSARPEEAEALLRALAGDEPS